MRILVADKDPYELAAMEVALSSPAHEIVTVMDGDEALVIAMQDPVRVVVTSASLGQMGGFALSRELKMLHERGDIPEVAVVVLLERSADAWLAMWSRADAHRTKPVHADDLQNLVRELGSRSTAPA